MALARYLLALDEAFHTECVAALGRRGRLEPLMADGASVTGHSCMEYNWSGQ